MSDSDTRVGFQVLFAVSPKILTNRTPAPESDTDTRTRVHVTLATSCKSEQSHLSAAFYLCLVPLPYGPEGSSWWVRHYKAGLST